MPVVDIVSAIATASGSCLLESGFTGVKAFRWAEVHGKKAS